jgi:hypothetical protein
MNVYEVVEKHTNEDGILKSDRRGLFGSRRAAQSHIDALNFNRVRNIMNRVARMTGYVRGKNAANFSAAITQVATTPYQIVEINVGSRY